MSEKNSLKEQLANFFDKYNSKALYTFFGFMLAHAFYMVRTIIKDEKEFDKNPVNKEYKIDTAKKAENSNIITLDSVKPAVNSQKSHMAGK